MLRDVACDKIPDFNQPLCSLSGNITSITFRPLDWEVAVSVVCIGFSWRENFYNSDLRCGSAMIDVNKIKRHLYSAQAKLYFILSIVKVSK